MKKNFFLIGAFNALIILFGCNSNSDKTKENTSTQNKSKQPEVAAPTASCYILENKKDTVSLKIIIDKNKVSGDLLYQYSEKDRNTGTIQGEMKGDTLFATYTFMSEGKESKRDVVFIKNGDELMEGYAIINSTTGEPDFTNHSEIKFDDKFILKKSDCQ